MKLKTYIRILCAAIGVAAVVSTAQAQTDVRFDITRFQVEGNSLLPQTRVDELVGPFVGKQRVYGDVQKALEALENAYRKAGFGTVQVFVPEQELAAGVVRLVVTESVVGKVVITSNKHYGETNIRAGLPALQEGKAPNMRELSENIQLSNDNPAKQLEVTLGVSEDEGKVDAKINVTDDNPQRFIFTADNTGTNTTGQHRIGLAYQHANVLDRDQVLTLAATTSAERPSAVTVLSGAYRLPFYGIGDALDIIYGKSTANVPVAQATGLNIVGKGEVFALRWNHYLPRRGEYTSKVILGYDKKDLETCVGAFCTPVRLEPLSVTYVGQRLSAGQLFDYSLGVAGSGIRPQPAAGPANFVAYRLSGSYMRALPADWTTRVAFSSQYSPSTLPDAEKFGVAGSTAVRGFHERVVAGDYGYFANAELITPELISYVGLPGSLKAFVFADVGEGVNHRPAVPGARASTQLTSLGLGLRYGIGKQVALQAYITSANVDGPIAAGFRKDTGSFALQITY
ncbi:MAG: ShlB/FhaC/HecB family hemolysin secretion/activation protein [Gammaproteobacteria bacterium]|nr:ShlB/FhaC/HecB family hemolysin secretion/activation protein [Gammaproteobacteria bacterium]MBU1647655.1 ShlB/FhaC/HecB family hemolysin secretion/activation protein [Gammaproteobacteria bacterium]MBU1971801.1 ShlB/FhaC/HecB family hemolysin secretion/activation protein [Gammaproteobacteria bacterium]